MKKINRIVVIALLLMIGLIVLGRSKMNLMAANPSTPESQWQSPPVTAGRLVYGYSVSLAGEPIPNVEYLTKDGNRIAHIFRTGTDGILGGSNIPLNLIETDFEYTLDSENKPTPNPIQGDKAGAVSLAQTGINGKLISAQGAKKSDPSWKVDLDMEANARNSAVLHTFTITNDSDESRTVYPIKFVDTELNNFDKVPIMSRGPNKGLYIESDEYRLDYNTAVDNGPIAYMGYDQAWEFNAVFGPDKDDQANYPAVKEAMQKLENEVVMDNVDTGIYMTWGAVTLGAHESRTLSYEVAIRPMKEMTKSKTAVNLTHPDKDEPNQVGDIIEYTIKMEADGGFGYKNVQLKDELSWAFENPMEKPVPVGNITIENSNGNAPIEIPFEDAFTKNVNPTDANPYVGTLNIPGPKHPAIVIDDSEVITIKFKVQLAAKSAGMDVTNLATVTGTTTEETDIEEDVETDTPLPIENIGKVIVKYQDETGNKIHEDDSISGLLGSEYDATSKKIDLNGYKYEKSIGDDVEGEITLASKEVIFVYSENRFTINQAAVKADDSSAASVKVEDEISYKVSVESKLNDSAMYKNFTISGKVSGVIELANVKDFKLVASLNGVDTELDLPTYNPATGEYTATVKETDNVPSNANLIVTYNGKVNADAEPGDIITAEAKASGDYTDGMVASELKATDFVSTVTAGQLIFESAPATMNFGDNHGIKLTDQVYPLETKDQPLSVRDLRGSSNQWTMMASVTTPLTNASKNNHQLPNALYYQTGGTPIVLTDTAVKVVSHTTTSTGVVDISQSWDDAADNRPYVKVKGGEAKSGAYSGTIMWTLRDGL
ncbi:MucBP domain-containing protein [Vagococcus sp. BWB3-3]|uniref:MucBP domain-containing protein n=1 Tax=Vagococcus allomyrinae TaxID=2794353 RepID=A0A940P7N6_9ENTE|nr:MucBP domain-containing protein [Vagococcus allomyrinae]